MKRTLQLFLLAILPVLPRLPSQDKASPAQAGSAASSGAIQSKGVRSLTQSNLDAIRDRVLPLVERHAGRKFKSIPKLQLTHNSTLGRILNEEFEAQFKQQFPTLTKNELERFTSRTAGLTALGLLGKFDTQSKVLYILPGMFDILVKAGQITKRNELDLLTIIVAHELTHALQDTYFPISEAIAGLHGQAALHAYSGCLEGHATHVQDLIAKELGLETAAKEYHTLLVGKKVKVRRDFGLRYQRSLSSFYYSLGAQFFEALEKKGGKTAVWNQLKEPPSRSDFLYGSPIGSPTQVAPTAEKPQLLAGLASFFTRRPRRIMASTADQTLLRCVLVSAKKAEVDEILNPLRKAWFVQVGTSPIMGLTLGMQFTDAKAARRFFKVAPQLITNELDTGTRYETKLVTDLKIDGVPLREIDLGMDRTTLTYTYRKGKFGQVKGAIRWYLENSYVVQIDISNLRTNVAQIDKMAKRALTLMAKN